jgi:hypothetical protein
MADFQSADATTQVPFISNTCDDGPQALTRHLHTDPDLARVIDAWPGLPAHIKAAVLTLISGRW